MRKILIVEDDFFIRDIYTKVFTQAGYAVVVAVDGEDALNQITSNPRPFDMILLDIMMPKMNGLDVLKKIRAMAEPIKSTAVFILTNLGQDTIIQEAFSIGMDGYIIKSQATPQQLVEEINTYFVTKQASPQ